MKKLTFFCLLLISVLVFSSLLSADQTGTSALDPQAEKVLKQMSEYMNTLDRFSFHIENSSDLMFLSGHKMQVGSAVDVSVRRPDRLHADIKGDIRSQQLFYDGRTITLFGRNVNYYATMDAPSTLEAALDFARERFGLVAPGADLVFRNSYDILTENVNSGYYVGLHNVHGVECHHLIFSQDNIDWQIWIENSNTPLPRKLIISEKWVTGGPQFTAVMSDWNLSPQLKDNLFTFVPPDKAEKIEFLPADKNGPDR
jgi:hypothetical protein